MSQPLRFAPLDESILWSVVVPVRSYRPELKRCIDSVYAAMQGRKDWELIVADQTDGNQVKLVCPLGNYCRHVLVPAAPNGPAAWNRALRLSRGQWTHLLHDDDWVDPGFYRELDVFTRLSCIAAWTGYRNVDAAGNSYFEQVGAPGYAFFQPQEWLQQLCTANHLQPVAVAISRQGYEQAGGYAEDYLHCADWHLYARLAAVGQWGHVGAVLANYRVHGNSVTGTTCRREQWHDYARCAQALWQLCPAAKDKGRYLMARRGLEMALDLNLQGRFDVATQLAKDALDFSITR